MHNIEESLASHPFIATLKDLRGNVRGCVYTEPLWAIPYNLYAPFATVYMVALGLSDSQVGMVASVGLAFQVFWTLMSGAITDKLGRKRTTFIFDLISWSVPCLIWAVAQDMTYFLAAAIVNSIWRVTANSWQCLLVEDTDPRLLVDVYSLIYIAGLITAFVAPLTSPLIERFDLVPTLRALYLLSFVMMTAKFVIMNAMVVETRQGLVRMRETRDQPLFAVLRGSSAVLRQILRTPATLFTAALMVMLSICWLIKGTFWPILVTEQLLIPPQYLVVFTVARSLVMLLFYFLLMPRLRHTDVRKPLIWGFLGLFASQVLLVTVPVQGYLLLMAATLLEAFSTPAVATLVDKLAVIAVHAGERARIMALLSVLVLVYTTPFGWIAGQLSEINRSLPFLLNIALFGACAILMVLAGWLVKGGFELNPPEQEPTQAG